MISQTYDGKTITYDEGNNNWRVDGHAKPFTSLRGAQEAIDRERENKKSFTRFSVIWSRDGGYHSPQFGATMTVTSISLEGKWFCSVGKERYQFDKFDIQHIKADTAENRELVSKISQLQTNIKALESQIEQLEEQFTPAIAPKDSENVQAK